jgi:large subunit ribosomal protein L23
MSLTAHDIIIRPVISEKSMDQAQHGKYTFQVHNDANKLQIAEAVAELFKVEVIGVNVLTTKSKVLRGRFVRNRVGGHSTPWRKAVVTLAPGQKIELFEAV